MPPSSGMAAFLHGSPLAVFALLLSLSVLVPPLARWLRLPDLVGLLAAGVLIGPHALGWLQTEGPTVGLLSDIGVIYLLFIAGLEIDLAEFARIRQRSFQFGLLTFSLALAYGYAPLSEVEAQLARWQPGAEGQAVSVAIKVDIRPDQNIETSIEDAARSHGLVILRSQRRLVAGLPIPAGGRMGGLMRRLSISVLVISDPLH